MNGRNGMNGLRQGWLVARREMRERGRSRGFRLSLVLMIVAVAAALIVPALLKRSSDRNVGLTGSVTPTLAATIVGQAHAVGITARIHRYESLAAGEQAVRQGHLSVLIADARRLEWQGSPDDQLKAVVTGAIQLDALRGRAAAAGIGSGTIAALMAPVTVTSTELGHVAGRSPADEFAVMIMTGVLFFSITTFGAMVLTGVLEEKSSRVVEVLLARIPARTLLAGKIVGIGLLGLAQTAVTALAALVAVATVHSIHVPAVRGGVLAWAVIWFVLGYALYATVYGALGSLGSRAEDAQSVAGPVTVVLVVGYFAAFTMIAQPSSAAAKAISYFPLTAPMAMPGRIAMGATAWWEPVAAAILTLATTAALVLLAGRLYTNAILHIGPRLSLKDTWRAVSGGKTSMTTPDLSSHRLLVTVLTGVGVALGVTVAVCTSDVIMGVIAGAGFIAIAIQMVKLWGGHPDRPGHPGPPAAHR
jgi:ABC-2 type transport system permease protein